LGAVVGVELKDLELATQVFYHLSHSTNPFQLVTFELGSKAQVTWTAVLIFVLPA
jgi:hypothetical protein